jgi:gas vesicle protein
MANKNLSTGLVTLLAGVGIGAVAGILFAPEKGSVLRKKIKDGATSEAEELKRKFKGFKRKAKEKAVEKEHEFEARFNNLLAKADHKADDVIATLEKKLNELKELKAKSTNK